MTLQYRTPPLAHSTLRAFDPIETPHIDDGSEIQFVILSKNTATGTYDEYAFADRASDAWTARRSLAEMNKDRKFFLRARRVYTVGPASQEAGEPCDTWRDAFRTGRDELVPTEQWAEYQKWVAGRVSARQAYARVNRDQPRWEN